MAEWLTTPYAWASFAFMMFLAAVIGYTTRGVAERIRRAHDTPLYRLLEEAWDEGWDASESSGAVTINPYRAARTYQPSPDHAEN